MRKYEGDRFSGPVQLFSNLAESHSKRVYFLEQDLTAMSGSASDSVFQKIPNTIEYHKSHSEGTGLLKGTAHELGQLKFNLANRFISSGKTRDAKFKSVTDCHFGDKNGHSASR